METKWVAHTGLLLGKPIFFDILQVFQWDNIRYPINLIFNITLELNELYNRNKPDHWNGHKMGKELSDCTSLCSPPKMAEKPFPLNLLHYSKKKFVHILFCLCSRTFTTPRLFMWDQFYSHVLFLTGSKQMCRARFDFFPKIFYRMIDKIDNSDHVVARFLICKFLLKNGRVKKEMRECSSS